MMIYPWTEHNKFFIRCPTPHASWSNMIADIRITYDNKLRATTFSSTESVIVASQNFYDTLEDAKLHTDRILIDAGYKLISDKAMVML